MAITRATTSSVAQGPSTRKTVLGGNDVILGGSYDAIGTVTVGSGGATTIDFTSIPSTYKNLQIRGIVKSSSLSAYPTTRINGDTGNNYNNRLLWGDGSLAYSYGPATNTYMDWLEGLALTAHFSAFVVDILDYTNTNKYKTLRSINGADANNSGEIRFSSGLWRSTVAITSINIVASSGNFMEHSSFALYGIK